jgi:hypothetical protein
VTSGRSGDCWGRRRERDRARSRMWPACAARCSRRRAAGGSQGP